MKTVTVPVHEVMNAYPPLSGLYPQPLSYEMTTDSFVFNQDAYDEWLRQIGQNTPRPQEVIETKPGRCECGSENAGSSRHSTWCPAFEK